MAGYKEGSMVLCNTKGSTFYYSAKIIKEEKVDGKKVFTIHYSGWNSRYDEKISEDEVDARFKPWSEENEKEAKDAIRAAKSSAKKRKSNVDDVKEGGSSRGSTPVDGINSSRASINSERGRKRKRDDQHAAESTGSHKREIKVNIPEKLRAILVDDQDMIIRQSKLTKLPARVTIDDIIKKYAASLSSESQSEEENVSSEVFVEYSGSRLPEQVFSQQDMSESAYGVVDYFNAVVGSQLLYKFERQQYVEAVVEARKAFMGGRPVQSNTAPELEDLKLVPSTMYGLPHFLRLFVRLGSMLSHTVWGDRAISQIIKHLQDLLVYISKNVNDLYDPDLDYETATPEYQKNAFI